tara:strand:+ start:39048 stop:39599 length:552 start_codon:yes stop_codon:yes gene_type:complete
MKFQHTILTLGAALALTSCDAVVSSNHISKQTESLIQEELTGTWQVEDEIWKIEFDETDLGHVASLDWKKNQFEISRALFQGLKVDKTTIITLESPEEAENKFHLIAFRLANEETGNVFLPKAKAVAKLVEAGKFEGEVERGKNSMTVKIRDAVEMVTTTPLEELFDFGKPKTLKRVKPLEAD